MKFSQRYTICWRHAWYLGCCFSVILLGLPERANAQRVLGLDMSAWQGSISQQTWSNILNVENRQFVFLRSSRGGTTGFFSQNNAGNNNPPGENTLSQRYDDPYFVQNINRATNAGLFAGAYHFSRPDIVASTLNSNGIPNSGADEADHFIQMAGPWMRPGYLLPVHDFEAGDGARTDNQMALFAMEFSDRIYDVMGIRPAIYLNGNYAQNVIGGASSSSRSGVVDRYSVLWSARWPNQSNPDAIDVQNAHPKDSFSNIYGPWDDTGVMHPWTFWQYASTGRLQSFNNGDSNLDFNVAQGDIEFLKDQLVPAVWMTDSSGNWSTLSNWNSGQAPIAPVTGPGQVAPVGRRTLPTPRLPGETVFGVTSGKHDTVILDRPNADITVTLDAGSYDIRKLFVRESLVISGGELHVNYDPNYVSDTATYPNALRSGPLSAQFSAPVTLLGDARFSAHTVQVDAGQLFAIGGGTLSIQQLNLMPATQSPAKILLVGDTTFHPISELGAVIANGSGTGGTGYIDLDGGERTLFVGDTTAETDVTITVPVVNGGLRKDGDGKLLLAVASNYDGDTTVSRGVLGLSSAMFSDDAKVRMEGDGSLDLSFSGAPDVIDSLFVNGVSLTAGIWGAKGSGAQFTSPRLTGSGLLQVSHSVASGDFNQDGAFDGDDLDVLVAAIASGADAAALDLTGDDNLALDDLDAWLSNAGAVNLGAGKSYLPGDADLDGVVGALDFEHWNANKFTASATWRSGDFNADGVVDATDLNIWNVGRVAASSHTVPEPDSVFLLLGIAALMYRRCVRRPPHIALA